MDEERTQCVQTHSKLYNAPSAQHLTGAQEVLLGCVEERGEESEFTTRYYVYLPGDLVEAV